jgi:hypothetical protein
MSNKCCRDIGYAGDVASWYDFAMQIVEEAAAVGLLPSAVTVSDHWRRALRATLAEVAGA